MKRLLTAIVCMAIIFPAAAQDEHPGGWNFDIMGFATKTKESKKQNCDGIDFTFVALSGWGFGLNAATATPEGMSVDMGRSFHFFASELLGCKTKIGKNGSMSIGFGIDLKNFTMTGPARFLASSAHRVSLAPYPDGAVPEHSRLRIFSTTYNIKYTHKLAKNFKIAFGPELYVVRAPGKRHEIRNIYTLADGKDVNERFKGVRTNKVGLSLVGMALYHNSNSFGLYVKYTPTHYFSSERGPQFQSLSTGFIVFGL